MNSLVHCKNEIDGVLCFCYIESLVRSRKRGYRKTFDAMLSDIRRVLDIT